ncbi:MAG TPA: hypothetical protein VF217_03520 [Rhodanobacteraceae bacterium]
MDYYHGRPLGNEVEGRSQVVTQDTRDTIEWVMPQLMRMFAGTDETIRFEPEGPEDEALAEQETEVVNYYLRKSDGFMVLHDFAKDGLLLKNGYVKVWWEKRTCESFEQYTGLTLDELTLIIQQIEATGDKAEIDATEEVYGVTQMPDGSQAPNVTYNVKLRRIKTWGEPKAECIPPENMRVSPRVKHDIQSAPFIGHVERLSRTDLLELGFDEDDVESLGKDERQLGMQQLSRNSVVDETAEDEATDASMDEIEVLDAYVRVDYDGDGRAELRHVVKAEGKLLLNEEATEIPYAYWSPIRMPHRHVGVSLHDLLKDLTDIKTALTRQLIDNTFLINNPRIVYNPNVNQKDVLTSRPGAGIRTSGVPSADVFVIPPVPIADALLPVISHIDQIRMERTGVSNMLANLDPDSLQNVTKGAYSQASNAAAAKIEMIARMLAEGWKQVGMLMHSLIVRHQDKKFTIRLRNKWVPVDPTTWRTRADATVNVGLGAHNQDQRVQRVMAMGGMLQQAAQAGIVLPGNVYNAALEGLRALEFKEPERFVTDPSSPQFQQHQQQMQSQPNPLVQAEQVRAQAKVQVEGAKLQAKQQADMTRAQADALIEHAKVQAKVQSDAADREVRAQSDMAGALLDARLRYEQMLLNYAAAVAKADAIMKADVAGMAIEAARDAEQEFPLNG